jgi:DNA-binding transcriptional MerR regulator
MRPMTSPTKTPPGIVMTIGEASRRSGFTVKALRFYERRGILPASKRRSNGYRLYGDTDLHRLSFIHDAKALGLTLGAIADIVRSPNDSRRARLLGVLDRRITEATERIAALTRLREELERRRRAIARGSPSDRSPSYCTCLKQSGPAE